MRKTKIICTMGPANDDEQVLRRLMLGGMDVARFNFSHSDHAAHKQKLDKLVKLRTGAQPADCDNSRHKRPGNPYPHLR